MAEPRRKPAETNIIPLGDAPRARAKPRMADGSEAPGAAPVQAQIETLTAAFSSEAAPRLRGQPLPGFWRAALVMAAALAIWASVFAGASRLLIQG